jgi:hypothetical protein
MMPSLTVAKQLNELGYKPKKAGSVSNNAKSGIDESTHVCQQLKDF